jgi:Fe-Mn family superoxide dismutase
VGATLTPAIDPAFGSAGELEAASTNAAVELFGSGWVWLVRKPGSLEVVATRNADTPLRTGDTCLLVCDVWEHAY